MTTEPLCARDANRRLIGSIPFRDLGANAVGFCGNPVARFPVPLSAHINVRYDGDINFDYVADAGQLIGAVSIIGDRLDQALRYPAKDRAAKLRELAKYIDRVRSERELAGLQWSAHLDAVMAASELRRRLQ